eukprot:GABW01003225.1.p2 GENE.GABW01003225.1~~GABW01003225.1.p2  ORF type:complete len:56 (-),score=4.70 GABW01003225.1:29-196(-)
MCVWRGSQGWQNWLMDFDAIHVPFMDIENATIEAGFSNIYKYHKRPLYDEILSIE